MTVSATLIVRNESATLARCLRSIRDAVDEIVVVDTGSDDDTRDIAGQYAEHVFDFPWRDDFAAARQFALERATGDWVFWLDADDVVCGAERIRPGLAALAAGVGQVYWRYRVGWDERGKVTCEYWRERCVRNDGSARWQGRIHEVLVASGEICYVPEVVVEHRPPTGRNNLARNIAIMETVRRDEGESPRLLFYLGRDYAQAGETDRALQTLRRYVEIAVWDDEKYQAQTTIAELLRRQGRYGEALDADLAALKTHPTWPDAYFGLARTYYFLRDWSKVTHWSEIGEMFPQPETVAILNPMDYRYNWIIYYTNALYHVGRLADALRWTRRALEMNPDDQWHRANDELFSRELATKSDNSPGPR